MEEMLSVLFSVFTIDDSSTLISKLHKSYDGNESPITVTSSTSMILTIENRQRALFVVRYGLVGSCDEEYRSWNQTNLSFKL
jgi:hypothetical protein